MKRLEKERDYKCKLNMQRETEEGVVLGVPRRHV